jgi:hypothetical protein
VAISWGRSVLAPLPRVHRTTSPDPHRKRSTERLVLVASALLSVVTALGLTLLSLIELTGAILGLASIIVPVLIVVAATFLSVADRLDRS